ncbi:MAG: hypothetical protein JEZ11_04390 [Desulfobacterales bacterium]|nr:hypothetical protein [Desulfobacterales bacterium]
MYATQIETVSFSADPCDGSVFREALSDFNRRLDALAIPYDINESVIEALLDTLDTVAPSPDAIYWLLLARVTELALMAAGHYADHCEFSAAGDLLVNPRTIRVCWDDQRRPAVKERHERLSDQFRRPGVSRRAFVRDFKDNGRLETLRPALLPVLAGQLAACGLFSSGYLAAVNARMEKITEAIGFLCAAGITTGRQLYLHLTLAPAADRDFFTAHLCRFDRCHYDRLGREVDRWYGGTLFNSAFFDSETLSGSRAADLYESVLQ